jgi:hypothetical protein
MNRLKDGPTFSQFVHSQWTSSDIYLSIEMKKAENFTDRQYKRLLQGIFESFVVNRFSRSPKLIQT